MDWYYLSDSQERIAISEAQLVPMAARGIIRPATPVWRKGMGDWAACGEVKPEVFTSAVTGRDHPHPAAESAAVRGTIIGLARTLAAYNVWLRIFGVLQLLAALMLTAGLAWITYVMITAEDGDWRERLPSQWREAVPRAAVWAGIAWATINVLLASWSGWLALAAAARAKRSADDGSERTLSAAVQDAGRWAIVCLFCVLTTIAFVSAMVMWIGWDKAFPPEKKPAEKVISI